MAHEPGRHTAQIEDQTLRDGIQRAQRILSTDEKVHLVEQLFAAGVRRFQVTAFVNPRKVPQMADAARLVEALRHLDGATISALVLNMRGVERAILCGCRHIEVSLSASNTHSVNNTGMTRTEAQREAEAMISHAVREGIRVKMSVQCAFGCQYEGAVEESVVHDMVLQGVTLGAQEISLADTTGMATPDLTRRLGSAILHICQGIPLFLHLHDANGRARLNAKAALEIGITSFDVTVGGTGGCPFIPQAPPNLSLETAVTLLHQHGIFSGISLEKLPPIRAYLTSLLTSPQLS